jgi:uridine kinase
LIGASLGHPVRVAVDGITAAGKTTLAREITAALAAAGRPGIHLSLDGFHHPRARRHQQGRWSARGYYEDAYDVDAFVREVLRPLGPAGNRRYRTQVLDLASVRPVADAPLEAPADAVLLVDGTFLHRPELVEHWDRTIFVDTAFDLARDRGVRRDAELFGGPEAATRAYDLRYHPASRLYLDSVNPRQRATVVFGNDEPAVPTVVIGQPPPRPPKQG